MKPGKSMPKGIPHNKIRKRTKISSTPGKSKPSCIASTAMKNAAKRSRAYKQHTYIHVLRAWDKRKK